MFPTCVPWIPEPSRHFNVLFTVEGSEIQGTTCVECGGKFLTKPKDIANHVISYFDEKIKKYKHRMIGTIDTEYCISNSINRAMNGNYCSFEFTCVTSSEVKKCLDDLGVRNAPD
jgi:hypothetical protein